MKKRLFCLTLVLCLAGSLLSTGAEAADGVFHVSLRHAEDLSVLPDGAPAVELPVCTEPGPYDFTLPAGPARPGFAFAGWRLGDAVCQPGDTVHVTGDLEFCAQWTRTHPFADLPDGCEGFYEMLDLYEKGLMTGAAQDAFSPDVPFTRAMLWTVLARIFGAETGGSPWYQKAQEAVAAAGVSDGQGPDRPVTRQELLTMLYRRGGSPEVRDLQGLDAFPGADRVAGWAREAMWWSLQTRVLYDPQGSGELDPARAVTRREAAVSLSRWLALYTD